MQQSHGLFTTAELLVTECSEITFQILKFHAEILIVQFLNSILMQYTEITTVLCYLAVLGKSFLTISNHKKHFLIIIESKL